LPNPALIATEEYLEGHINHRYRDQVDDVEEKREGQE